MDFITSFIVKQFLDIINVDELMPLHHSFAGLFKYPCWFWFQTWKVGSPLRLVDFALFSETNDAGILPLQSRTEFPFTLWLCSPSNGFCRHSIPRNSWSVWGRWRHPGALFLCWWDFSPYVLNNFWKGQLNSKKCNHKHIYIHLWHEGLCKWYILAFSKIFTLHPTFLEFSGSFGEKRHSICRYWIKRVLQGIWQGKTDFCLVFGRAILIFVSWPSGSAFSEPCYRA